MVGQTSGMIPTRVQILVLAPFPEYFRIYRRYALSCKRRSRHWYLPVLSPSDVLIGYGLRTYIHRSEFALVL
jgi:hypothetical protein